MENIATADANFYRHALAQLPLANAPVAQEKLRSLIRALYQSTLPTIQYLALLELTREPLLFIQETMSLRYALQSFPASEQETATFNRTVELWQLLANSYARVAQLGSGDPQIQEQLALICQRCIDYASRVIIEYFLARRALAPGLWMELHGYFDTADDWQLADKRVIDSSNDSEHTYTTCAQTYTATLLVSLANPFSRAYRELTWVLRWAKQMAVDTTLGKPGQNGTNHGYGIDLMQDHGPQPIERMSTGISLRIFNTSRLTARVQNLLSRLKAGEVPTNLGLGADCSRSQAGRLLLCLYRPWCLAAMPRRFERATASGELAVVYSLDAIYHQIMGKPFAQPAHTQVYSRAQVEQMWTFRYQIDPNQPLHLNTEQLTFSVETWSIANHSLTGFRASLEPPGARIEHSQLVAMQPPGRDIFMLAQVCWLFQEQDGSLHAGFQLLPGPAIGVALRPTGATISWHEKYSIGFLLPAVPSLKEPASLVIPAGWFSYGRIIEVFTDRSVSLKLIAQVGRGSNFERCTFAAA